MSLADYEDFFYRACLCDDPEPVDRLASASRTTTRRLAEWIKGKEEVHIQAPGTDIKLDVAGRTVDPVRRATTTCPTASSSPARSRTR